MEYQTFSLSRMNPCDVHQVIKLLDKLSRSFDNNSSARFKFYIYFLHQVITILVPFFFFSSIHLGTPRRNIKLQSAYPNPPSACYIYSVEPKIKMKPFIFWQIKLLIYVHLKTHLAKVINQYIIINTGRGTSTASGLTRSDNAVHLTRTQPIHIRPGPLG